MTGGLGRRPITSRCSTSSGPRRRGNSEHDSPDAIGPERAFRELVFRTPRIRRTAQSPRARHGPSATDDDWSSKPATPTPRWLTRCSRWRRHDRQPARAAAPQPAPVRTPISATSSSRAARAEKLSAPSAPRGTLTRAADAVRRRPIPPVGHPDAPASAVRDATLRVENHGKPALRWLSADRDQHDGRRARLADPAHRGGRCRFGRDITPISTQRRWRLRHRRSRHLQAASASALGRRQSGSGTGHRCATRARAESPGSPDHRRRRSDRAHVTIHCTSGSSSPLASASRGRDGAWTPITPTRQQHRLPGTAVVATPVWIGENVMVATNAIVMRGRADRAQTRFVCAGADGTRGISQPHVGSG